MSSSRLFYLPYSRYIQTAERLLALYNVRTAKGPAGRSWSKVRKTLCLSALTQKITTALPSQSSTLRPKSRPKHYHGVDRGRLSVFRIPGGRRCRPDKFSNEYGSAGKGTPRQKMHPTGDSVRFRAMQAVRFLECPEPLISYGISPRQSASLPQCR